ncbi:hypothetical protein [Streptomyces sp. NPDC048111]|uniref:hypothetical protein n=1 Tax=Streptomyces sp. NPDC048111 TaxID=3365500 RepID=UPI003723FE1E
MADKNSRWNHPHWHLLIVIPLLIFLVTEDNTITRCLLASALTLAAVRYGRDSAAWARAKAAPDHAISGWQPTGADGSGRGRASATDRPSCGGR